jgi:hypothetical protein
VPVHDVLEQVVSDYLRLKGYFTMTNIRYRPRTDHPLYNSKIDSVTSDIDVLGFNPTKRDRSRVMAVSCKSWQAGFKSEKKLGQLRGDVKDKQRPSWKAFREVWEPKWSEAFRDQVEATTGQRNFLYRIAVTRLIGDGDIWGEDPTIQENLEGCDFGFLEMNAMWAEINGASTKTPEPSDIGRLAQLLKAAGVTNQSEAIEIK